MPCAMQVGLIRVLDDFVTEDSELLLFSDVPLDVRTILLLQVGLWMETIETDVLAW